MTGTERGNLLNQLSSKLMFDKYDGETVRREIADGCVTINGRVCVEPGLIVHEGDRISVSFRDFMHRCAVDVGPSGKAWTA